MNTKLATKLAISTTLALWATTSVSIAAVALEVTKPPVIGPIVGGTGPLQDPTAAQGQ